MNQIRNQVNRAYWKLFIEKFLHQLAGWLFGCLMLAAIAVLVAKFWSTGIEAQTWFWGWVAGSATLALIGAAVTTWLTAVDRMDAAIVVDQRFGLKERLSSAMALTEEERQTAAGEALLKDAVYKAERIDIGEQFRFQGRWFNLLPLAPAALVFLIAVFVPEAAQQQQAAASTTNDARKKQVETSTDKLAKKIAEQKKKLESKEKLDEAQAALAELQKGVADMRKLEDLDQKKAMVKLNDLAEQIKKRKQSMGDSEKLKKQLSQLKNIKMGPGDRMAKAIKRGDFSTAMKEIKELETKLRTAKISPEQQKQLAEQLKQLSKRMNELASSQQEAKEALRREIDRAKRAGDLQKAGELQNKMEKLAAQDKQMDKLSKLAQKMQEASKQLNSGDNEQAAQQLAQMAEEMSDLDSAMEQIAMLDEALAQLGDAKNSMSCESCGGEGCKLCDQGSEMSSMLGMSGSRGNGRGMGMGEGEGVGDRPEAKTNKNFYDSRVRANARKGRAVITGLTEGPNLPGEALEEIKLAIESSESSSDDPLSGSKLPRDLRDHAEEYFNKIRGDNQ